MLETEPSSATWTSRTTLPARWAARASGILGLGAAEEAGFGLRGRQPDALGWGDLSCGCVVAIFVVDDASTTESLSCLVESGLAWRFAWSGFVGAGLMRKMTLPFS